MAQKKSLKEESGTQKTVHAVSAAGKEKVPMPGNEKTKQRLIGTVVPVGAIRGNGSMGVGEFPDLEEFALLCKKMDIGLIQILPVNDTGYWSSPYFSLTAFALHPLYLRIEALDEFGKAGAAVKEKIRSYGTKFDKETRFPYEAILRAKMEILRDIYAAVKDDIAKKAGPGGSLAAWLEANSWVKEYAVYRRLKEANGEKGWKEWESRRSVSPAELETLWNDPKFRDPQLFWVWVQEALDRQFSAAAKAVSAAGLILEGDIPILMNEDSCDVWAHPEYFHTDLSAGAPPDMYGPDGQNWGFPLHNWQAQSKNNYAWWRLRLKVAEKYYSAYRIDHVLGFFRIWSSGRQDNTSILGRYVPYIPVTGKDLQELGFDAGRIRWVSQPHIPTEEVWDSMREMLNDWENMDSGALALETERIFSRALSRVGSEELWLFQEHIRGERDIDNLNLHQAAQKYLYKAWHNRLFYEYNKGQYFPTWFYRESRAYASLSAEERDNLEALLEKRRLDSEKIWEEEGKKLLSMLSAASSMLPCAEDLGAVPACVPKVLTGLKIMGLRVLRWHREWVQEGEPYIPFEDYPELSVCTPAVHDSSTVRDWWDNEADQPLFCDFIGVPSLPKVYNPGAAKVILQKIASAASRFRVFQIQDLLHLSPQWYAPDPASERINVPGTYNEFDWTYRLPASMAKIGADAELVRAVKDLAAIKPGKKKPK
ncbi:MAG: 4-alpha-glucanotransferase [Treponema sp.]|jgi:4-alpha-glucanotransferase|nr:4-alpha-glucanotransferase [Treponema sp.]